MLERTLENLKDAKIRRVLVVLGDRAAEIRRSVSLGSATVVQNPAYAEGMGSSLRAGVAAAGNTTRWVMIVLADQPFVSATTFQELARQAKQGDGRIYIPTYKGVWGNPVIFDTSLAPEVAKIEGDIGCRAIFPNHTSEIREVSVDDPGVLVDIDTEAELHAVASAVGSAARVHELLDRLAAPRWSLHVPPTERPVPKTLRRGPDIPALAQELRAQRTPFALATVVRVVRPTSGRPGYQAIIREDGSHVGWVGGACTEELLVAEARAAIAAGAPRLLRVSPEPAASPPPEGVVDRAMTCQSGGTVEIFIDPNLPRPTLLIVGDSPVATSLAALGPLLGYRVVLVAPGVEPSELPDVDEFVPELEPLTRHLAADTYAVVASMGKYDEAALEFVLMVPVAFVGLVASRKRAQSVFAVLREDGATAEQVARVRNPVGIRRRRLDPRGDRAQHHGGGHEGPPVRVPSPGPRAPSKKPRSEPAIDPVCHMEVERSSPLRAAHEGTTYYFCSEMCRRKFSKSPAQFLA